MTTTTLLLLSLTSVALFTSIFALSAVLRSSDRSLSRQLSGLSTRLREVETTLDELSAQLKALRQRENMRAYRSRKAGKSDDPEPELDLDDTSGRAWVQQMNERLARARLGVPK